MSYTNVAAKPKMDVKGLQAKRRDSCAFVRDVQETFLRKSMTENYEAAVVYLIEQIDRMRNGRVPIEELTFSKLLRSNYKNPQEHAEVRKKMLERDAASAPQIGDRIPFVYIENASKRAYEKAEDPAYVKANGIPIDCAKYLARLKSSLNKIIDDEKIESIFFPNKSPI